MKRDVQQSKSRNAFGNAGVFMAGTGAFFIQNAMIGGRNESIIMGY